MSATPPTSRPRPRPGLRWAELADATLLVDAEGDALHLLNPLAGAIFALCDGLRSGPEIAQALDADLGELAPPLEEVERWLSRALDAGYLVARADEQAIVEPVELDLADLHALARKLRTRGDIELSLRVQTRVAQLDGESPEEWLELGELAHILGQRSLARAAYERFLELEPGDPEVAHMLLALRDESPPARASDECIRHLYERFAPDYDRSMGDDLDFAAPRLLVEALEPHLGAPRAALDVLDLGCGTGLSGERLRPWARKLVGVDLSEDMLRLAATRGAHDELVRAELTGWLGQCSQRFELIVACDVLIYFGELAPILERAASLLCEGGMLAFTLELHDGAGWTLTDSGRYAHSAAHVRELARDADLHELRLDEVVLRQEYGAEVRGLRVVLAREQA